jgi:hypothetical protein
MLYRVEENRAMPMTEVVARNEAEDLHLLLANNLALIPGDQINPESPREWLLVGNEMPVPDPETGGDRWSLDMLIGDQDACPTLIEVKRAADPRSRREVVAQMLDYAANGHHYWQANALLRAATQAASDGGRDLDSQVARFESFSNPEEYFATFEENLREGRVRLVFFLDRANRGLTSIVEFLNRQMVNAEAYVVEARLFEDPDKHRYVQPHVFGYVEEARRARAIVAKASKKARTWTRDETLDALSQEADAWAKSALSLIHAMENVGFNVGEISTSMGPGVTLKDARFPETHVAVIKGDGALEMHMGWGDATGNDAYRDRVVSGFRDAGVGDPRLQKITYVFLENAVVRGHESEIARALASAVC